MKYVVTIVLLLYVASSSFASELSNQIEEQILNKDWQGVHSTLNNLKAKSSKEREYFGRLTESTKAVTRFFRDYDVFVKLDGNEAMSYGKTLNNDYNSIPRKLPFSVKMINEIKATKVAVNERLVKIDENLQKQKDEMIAKRAEIERRHKEEEAIKEQQVQERIAQQEKERSDRERYMLAQDEVEKSPEYLKMDLLCKICGAIEEKRSVEKALNTDMSYSKKYGVVNLSRRDNAVQVIKADDRIIQEGKRDYMKLFNKPFTTSSCKHVKCDECEGTLQQLSKTLTEKYLAEHP